jgi:hypothetical protein
MTSTDTQTHRVRSLLGEGTFLIALIVVASALRFWRLDATGIFGVDDGRYILDGYSKFVESEGLIVIVQGKLAEFQGGDEFVLADALAPLSRSLQEHHPFSPKLGFTYFTAIAMWTNVSIISAASYVEATAGALLVLATYLLIRCGSNARAAIIGAIIMAFSPYAVYYSRNAYPQSTSALFIVAAVILLSKGPRYRHLLVGISLGIAFWVHYQAAAAIIAFVAVYAGWSCAIARPGIRRVITEVATNAIGFAFVCIFAEAITYPHVMLFRAAQLDYPHKTFFELLAPRIHSQLDFGINPSGLLVMPYAMMRFHGIAGTFAILTLGGCAVALIRGQGWRTAFQSRSFALFIIPAVAITVLYAFKHGQVFRMYLFTFPFWAACIGVAMDRILREPSRYARAVAVATITIAAVSAIAPLMEIMRLRSAYPDAITFARNQNATLVSGWSSTLEAYLLESDDKGGDVFAAIEVMPSDQLLYVADWQELYYDAYPDTPTLLSGDAAPVKVFKHRFGQTFLEAELFHAEGNTWQEIANVRAIDLNRARTLNLYAVRDRPLKTLSP